MGCTNCTRLLLLGHACWAYVTGQLAAYSTGVKPNLYLLLLLGMLPDIDLVLGIFGVQHRTVTHSLLFWSILFGPFFARYRLAALPYFVAVAQHILLGDLVVGRTDILWPLDLRLGLGLPILSPVNLALEAGGLVLFVALSLKTKDLLLTRSAALAIIVIVPLAGFSTIASFSEYLLPVFLEGSDARHLERNLPALLVNPGLQAAVFLHLALIATIVLPFLISKKAVTQKLE
jgi:membrane-bound metal-dependent hydrolase YbcI (DUF457 family)